MPHLIVNTPENSQFDFHLDGDRVTVGRTPTSDLSLSSAQVSREHAEFTLTGSNYQLNDLGSSNGTLVNGIPIDQPVTLNDNDVIMVGDFQLFYRQPEGATPLTFALVGKTRPVKNQTFVLPPGKLRLGRSENNSLVVNHHSISRHHALLHVSPGGVQVEDTSSNGTFINDDPVETAALKPDDILRFGTVDFKVTQADPSKVAKAQSPSQPRLPRSPRPGKVAAAIAVMSVLVLGLTLAIAVKDRLGANNNSPEAVSQQALYESAIASHLVKARQLLKEGAWHEAATVYQSVLDKDPLNREGRHGLKAAQTNQGHQLLLRNATTAISENRPSEAVRKLRAIKPKDHYHSEAVRLRQTSITRLVETALNAAITACSDRQWRACHQAAIRILEEVPRHQDGLDLLKEAEMQMKRAHLVFTPWSTAY